MYILTIEDERRGRLKTICEVRDVRSSPHGSRETSRFQGFSTSALLDIWVG